MHATLEHVGDEWTFVDDGRSHNGSYIDGERVHGRRRLRDGDVIAVGRTTIVFRSPAAASRCRRRPHSTAPRRSSAARSGACSSRCAGPTPTAPTPCPASNRQIADELVLGVETIKTHMRALFDAFELGECPQHQKRAALAQRALESGLITARDFEG